MARIRKSLTFSPDVVARAEAVMKIRGFDELSDYTATLYREEYERRHPPTLDDSHLSRPAMPAAAPHKGPVNYQESAAQHSLVADAIKIRDALAPRTARKSKPAKEKS